jgi:hypothetical protein
MKYLLPLVGLYLIIDGSSNIVFSTDQSTLASAGRLVRIVLGVYLLTGHT